MGKRLAGAEREAKRFDTLPKPLAFRWRMSDVMSALAKAVGQLTDPAVLRVLVKTLIVTFLVFVALAIGFYQGLIWIGAQFGYSIGGYGEAALAALIAIGSAWLLFRVVALAMLQFFADEIVAAVEARHYPEAAKQAKPLPLRREIAHSLRGAGRALLFNALALPVAGVLFFTVIGAPAVFLLVNAVLLGRELTDMAWFRHQDVLSAGRDHPVSGPQRALLGGAMAALMLVPFANLIAPVIGAAAGTHLTLAGLARREQEAEKNA
ncbi:MAG: EI24 domain-containing protein [Pseudomonadota bacterium]